jgi:hypothetical protein
MCFKITHSPTPYNTQYTALLLSVINQKLCRAYRWNCEEYFISFNECSCIETENPDICNKFSLDLFASNVLFSSDFLSFILFKNM